MEPLKEEANGTFLDRLKLEHADLQRKLDKLDAYVDSSSFQSLPLDDQADLVEQREHMTSYVTVLFRRLNRLMVANG